jgi:hypothetical protein
MVITQRWARCTALAVLLLAGLHAGTVFAQSAKDLPPVELPETSFHGMGARALGMGAAYTAVSEDVTALEFNPAGLAQIRRVELSGGLVHSGTDRTVQHFGAAKTDQSSLRLDHLALAYPVATYRGSLVFAGGFHRAADTDVSLLRQGYAVPIQGQTPGLFELEDYLREGAVDQWTMAAAMDLSPNISVGASLSYLSGTSEESLTLANYRAVPSGGGVILDFGPDDALDERVFENTSSRTSDLSGYTGSIGLMGYLDSGFRVGLCLDLPKKLSYDVNQETKLEDWEKIDVARSYLQDDITLPLSVNGGVSWGGRGLLLSGGLRWTDYSQIDFEGKIYAPPSGTGDPSFARELAYKSVVAINAGGEYQFARLPLRLRAGFFTEPLPYKLIAGDTDFEFIADDGNSQTTTDASVVYRDYPEARIVSDRKYWTLGAGVLVQEALTLDIALVHGSWERETPAAYTHTTTFYGDMRTIEKVSQSRVFVSTTLHFE